MSGHRKGPVADQPFDPINAAEPNSARRYDYLLGGRTNFAADRESADAIAEKFPSVRLAAQENRRFLHRAVHVAAAELGIRQFLDIGTGLPLTPHVHTIARRVHPNARVVYVDTDPVVASHARAFLHRPPHTVFIPGDLRDPAGILNHPDLHTMIDLSQPVAVLLVAVLHCLTDNDDPHTAVDQLMQAAAPGSCLVLSHPTFDVLDAGTVGGLLPLLAPYAGHGACQPRTRLEIAGLLNGLTLEPPGLVPVEQWRPDIAPTPAEAANPATTGVIGAVARRP